MIEDKINISLRAILNNPASERSDWWVIGSTAAWLCGLDYDPKDVDLSGSKEAMHAFLKGFGVEATKHDDDPLFQSDPFHVLDIQDGLPIEIQGDLKVIRDGQAHPLICKTRIAQSYAGGVIYTVSPIEQIEMFRFFGRPKDLKKAAEFGALIAR